MSHDLSTRKEDIMRMHALPTTYALYSFFHGDVRVSNTCAPYFVFTKPISYG